MKGCSGDMVGWLCASASMLPFRLTPPPVNCGPSTLAVWFLHQHQPDLNLVTSIPAQRCPFLTTPPFFSYTGDAISRLDSALSLGQKHTDALPKAKPPPLFKSLHRETQTASPSGPPPSDRHHPSTRITLTPQHPPVRPSSWLPPTTTGMACRAKSPHRAPRSLTMLRHAVSWPATSPPSTMAPAWPATTPAPTRAANRVASYHKRGLPPRTKTGVAPTSP